MLEKYVDNREPDAHIVIRDLLANGWYVHIQGLLYTVLRKEVDDNAER